MDPKDLSGSDRTPRSPALLARVFHALFGSLRWAPPSWLVCLAGRVSAAARAGAAWRRAHRRAATLLALGLAVAGCGAGFGCWWQSRSKPAQTTIRVEPPKPMRFQEEDPRPDALVLHFSTSAAQLADVGKPVARGITLRPALPGTWTWLTDSDLRFQPTTEWAVGETYKVRFEPSLFPSQVHLDANEVRFATEPFTARISSAEYFQDETEAANKRIEVTIQFSHPVDSAELPRHVSLEALGDSKDLAGFGKGPFPFTVTFNRSRTEAYVHSDRIRVPPEDVSMAVSLEDVRAAAGGRPMNAALRTRISIPGLYNLFHVDGSEVTLVRNTRDEPEHVLFVKTNLAATEKQIADNLQAWILPKRRPALPGEPADAERAWQGPGEVSPEILRNAAALPLTAVPAEHASAKVFMFKMQAPVGSALFLRLRKGAQSWGGYLLARDHEEVVRVPAFPKEVAILQQGSLLVLGGERKLSVLARDMPALQMELSRVMPREINHLISQTGGTFAHPYFVNDSSQDEIVERYTQELSLQSVEPGKAQYAAFDLAAYLTPNAQSGTRHGLFFVDVAGWDAEHRRRIMPSSSRFVLVTDLGVLVKDAVDGTHDLFVQNLSSGEPTGGATVEVIGRNGVALVTATTDAAGHASFPDLRSFARDKAPTAYVVHKGDDLSFLPFSRADRNLNLSRFEIGGVHGATSPDKLDAFLFSDRGIYRPGDTFNIGLVVKAADWRRSVAGVPLEAVVYDARGLEVYKKKYAVSAAGFDELSYATEESAPTGGWNVSLYSVKDDRRAGLLGSTRIRVEEFLPDRLRIAAHLSTERVDGWISPNGLGGRVRLMNLFGTPATQRRITANVVLTPAQISFRAFRDYTFDDPNRPERSYTAPLPDGLTDDKGEAAFDLNLGQYASATYRITFVVEGFEAEGGRGVRTSTSATVSSLEHLVGYKPNGKLDYLDVGTDRAVELVGVDPSLARVAIGGLTAELVEKRFVSTLVQQDNGVYKYQSVPKELPVRSTAVAIPAAGLHLPLDTQAPGNFILRVRDAAGTLFATINYSVVGHGNLARALEKNAELELKLSTHDARPGQEIAVSVNAPYTGAGLITIERDRVYAWKWFKTTTTSTVQKIRVPAALEGNGYVTVTFLRGLDSPEVFMSPLSTGVAPFSVSLAARTNTLTLTTPELTKPGEPFRIGYRGTRPGKAVVFAVDEGILQVASYRTPDPLGYFFQKRALEVTTSQILDLLLPEYSVFKEASATGGDGSEMLGKNLNPFKRRRDKPVAFWSGIVDIDSTERAVSWTVPDSFNGTVRVMAVAISDDAVGAAQKTSLVRGPFVLNPNVPTFVAPGDEFRVSIGVANNVEGSGPNAKVALKLATSDHVEVVDLAQRSLDIAEGREASAVFTLRAKEKLGSATLTFLASLGGAHLKYAVDTSVRPSVPFMTTNDTGTFHDKSHDVPVARGLRPELRMQEASVSAVPLGMARGLVAYLDNYPYGCTEQLVSKAVPALVLRGRDELIERSAATVDLNLSQTLKVLRARQNADGAFGVWAASSPVLPIQTVYAIHFLTEARERGVAVPPEMLRGALDWARVHVRHGSPSELGDARTRAYAIYLLTRNGVVATDSLSTLREVLDRVFAKVWKHDLTAMYLAATYALLKEERQAMKLLDETRFGLEQKVDYAYYYDGLVYDSQYLYLLARHFPNALSRVPAKALETLARAIGHGVYNSYSSASAILGLDAYARAVGDTGATAAASIAEVRADGTLDPLKLSTGLFPAAAFGDKAAKLRFGSGQPGLDWFYQVTQAGFDAVPPKKAITQKLEVQREFRDAAGKVVSAAKLGEELEVHVKVRGIGDDAFSQIAIVDLLPGGFEVVVDRAGGSRDAEPEQQAGPASAGADETEGEGDLEPVSEQHVRWVSPIGSPQSSWTPDYVDVREDRVVLYGYATSSATEFIYRIKATNRGSFIVPPPFAEGMYDRGILARGLQGQIVVTDGK